MILVVDDEAAIVEAIGAVLEDEGYRVATASDGRVALEALRAGLDPCLAILDLMMPTMNGFELRAAMLEDPRLARVPVAILSAYLHHGTADLAVDRVLAKPFDLNDIVELARSYCGAPGQQLPS